MGAAVTSDILSHPITTLPYQQTAATAKTLPGADLCPLTLRASKLLLISAPSKRVWRSALDVSAPRSLPARSIRENLPCILPLRRRMIWNTAWLRDEWALADVWPDVLVEEERARGIGMTVCRERTKGREKDKRKEE